MAASVSVLMSTYNRAEYLGAALSGIINQTLPPQQIIVVNDGSTDDTESVLESFKDRIVRIRQDNAGKSVALNKALQFVTEEFVWVFDDDDLPFPDALARHVAALTTHPEAGFSYSPSVKAVTAPDGGLTPLDGQILPKVAPSEVFPRLLHSCFMLQQGSLCRAECCREVGSYREDLIRSLDYDYLLRLARRFRAVAMDEPSFYWRVHSGTRGTASDAIGTDERDMRWHRADQTIFREIHRDLALWEYLPHEPGSGPPETYDLASALLARVSVMGKKGLWDYVIADLRRLIEEDLLRRAPFALVMQGLEGAFKSHLAVRDLIADPATLKDFVEVIRSAGSDDLGLVCARKLYQFTHGEYQGKKFRNMYRMLRAALEISGVRGLTAVAAKKLARQPLFPSEVGP